MQKTSLCTPGAAALKTALDALFNHANTAPFFSKQMIQRLVTSNPNEEFGGPSTWLPPGEQVRYLCGMERERQRLVIQDGRLLWAKDGSPLDTGAATTWDGRSRAIYVVDNRGNIYAPMPELPS